MTPTLPADNRRQDLLDAALDAFVDRGYEGTTISQLAAATDMSKAAFVYHFRSKEDLLFELSAPLLDELDAVVVDGGAAVDVRSFLADYLDTLWRHRKIATWIDGDKSILNHEAIGPRLDTNNQRAHRLLAGAQPAPAHQALASGVLGMLWRPVRNGYLTTSAHQDALVDAAAQTAESMRPPPPRPDEIDRRQ